MGGLKTPLCGVSSMEHIDLINRIIEAEQRARELSDEARDKRAGMFTELEAAAADMRGSYLERAHARIEKVREFEDEFTRETLEGLEKTFNEDMISIETAFERNHDKWVDELFVMIVGR